LNSGDVKIDDTESCIFFYSVIKKNKILMKRTWSRRDFTGNSSIKNTEHENKIQNIDEILTLPEITVINGSMETSKMDFSIDQEFVSKKYVDDSIPPEIDISGLEQKTTDMSYDSATTTTFIGNTFHVGGFNILTVEGAETIQSTLKTDQVAFTDDQELITKKYVDDLIPATVDISALEEKITDISHENGTTTVTNQLEVGGSFTTNGIIVSHKNLAAIQFTSRPEQQLTKLNYKNYSTPVQNGNVIFNSQCLATDGTTSVQCTQELVDASEDFTTSGNGVNYTIKTTRNGTLEYEDRLKFKGNYSTHINCENLLTDGNIKPMYDNNKDLGGESNHWKDLYLSGSVKRPPAIASVGISTSHIDYTSQSMTIEFMRSTITNSLGGTNRCWGETATFRAGMDLKAGRVVSLTPTTTDAPWFLVSYLNGDYEGKKETVYPIGVTQENAIAGTPIKVCTRGFTTAICSDGNNAPKRGAAVFGNDTSSEGRVQINEDYASTSARIGMVAQTESVNDFGAVVIYFNGNYV
jgi:hypothetical protein